MSAMPLSLALTIRSCQPATQRLLPALLVATGLSACSIPPVYERPAQPVPAHYKQALAASAGGVWQPAQAGQIAAEAPAAWWTLYGDAQLNALVTEALANNTDLARAAARIDESRALVRLARADALPVVGGTAGAARQRSGANAGLPAPVTANNFNIGLNVSWEVDLWGRLAAGSRAAREGLAATVYTRDALQTALAAPDAQSDYARLQELTAKMQMQQSAVDRLYARWTELSEKVGG